VITTYLNWPLLRDRCLPSILAQTYERWEAIVVGDAAPDEARRVVESFGDDRIRFANLPYRGPYPSDPLDAWHMSGTAPWNAGLELAQGTWIGANSDDDALRPTSIEALLRHARAQHAEVPYGCLDARVPDRPSEKVGVFPPMPGQWGMQAALFHGGLRYLRLQPSDWVFGVPNDVALLERMLRIGVRFGFLDEPVVDYYPSRLWSDREQRPARREVF
jgi:glycosyltransferase involved in cell wall biosynthesis